MPGIYSLQQSCPFFFVHGVLWAEEALKLESETDRISYSLGHQIGNDLKARGWNWMRRRWCGASTTQTPALSPLLGREEMSAILGDLKGRISATQREEARERRARKQKEAEEKRRKGQEFLAENRSKPGVKTLPSGLQYKVIKSGTGKKPGPQDIVRVRYRDRLINGHEFDSFV